MKARTIIGIAIIPCCLTYNLFKVALDYGLQLCGINFEEICDELEELVKGKLSRSDKRSQNNKEKQTENGKHDTVNPFTENNTHTGRQS